MSISSKLDQLHIRAKGNRWLRYFAIFNRVALAIGFIPPGLVKIRGERFTSLSNNHPMGHYLEALHHTGYYYTFIGVIQVTAGLLLLIPRTALLGALLYFPVILNICILSFAVRFDGSLLSSPLMVLGDLYLLCWYYDRLKYILPFNPTNAPNAPVKQKITSNKFPFAFFSGVAATMIIVVLVIMYGIGVMPRNTLSDCQQQFKGSNRTQAGYRFCDCIHIKGKPLDESLEEYRKSPDDSTAIPGSVPSK